MANKLHVLTRKLLRLATSLHHSALHSYAHSVWKKWDRLDILHSELESAAEKVATKARIARLEHERVVKEVNAEIYGA